jgi:DNA-binding response OmpR family regulator
VRILIAEDDRISRQLLIDHLKGWKHEVVAVADGRAALDVVQGDEPFDMAILDWMMPHRSGIDVCEAIKKSTANRFTYVIMLTAKEKTADLAEAFKRGADDFVKKPFDPVELKARVLAGERIALLQSTLSKKVTELQDALAHVKQLQKILPICAWCKKVRDDTDYWHNVEDYVAANSETEFSHGICPECAAEHYPDVTD